MSAERVEVFEEEKPIDVICQRSRARKNASKEVSNAFRRYFFKQKLCGLALIIIGCLIPFVDQTASICSVMIIPLGLYVVLTKEKVMYP